MTQNRLFSLVTYNIHKGFGVGFRFLLPEMRKALLSISADFVFLQEVQGFHRRRAKRIATWPALPQFEFVAGQDWPYYLYAKNAIYHSGHHGNAILSKFPLEQFENINLSTHNRASRSILHAQVDIGGAQNLHLLCVHFGLLKTERTFQTALLMKRIREAVPDDAPLIMAGDFNDWRVDVSKPLLDELGICEIFQQLNGSHARSFPAIKPTWCVDRIYYRGLLPQKAHCLQDKPWPMLSDHLPLVGTFIK